MQLSSPDRQSDLAECGELLRGGSRTFFAASLLLPRSMREPASALYAFCRLADDAVDLGANAGEALDGLRERLARVYEGRPMAIAADRALAEVVARFRIPAALPEALLEGFEWDATGRRYANLDALLDYAARVAGTVGAMMSVLMGGRAPAVVARACDLGVAMQLTNIARDVGEDARNGRLYLPRAWLREAGIDPDAWLAAPRFDAAIGRVIQRLLDAADELYRRSEIGIGALPRDCRPAINAARLVYAEIGRQIEQSGLDSVSQRAVVSRQRKLALIARATAAAFAPSGGKRASPPALPAVQYLIDACDHADLAPSPVPVPGEIGQIGRVIELFERQIVAQRALR